MQLLSPLFDRFDTAFATTVPGLTALHGVRDAGLLPDCNANQPIRLAVCAAAAFQLLRRVRPDVIISTGAAPGIICIAVGRLLGIRTIWLDSVANVDRLSLSGRIARWVAHSCLTQWEHLAGPGVEFHGRLL